MINKTVGSGGDYATLYDACIALNALGSLTDDYTVTQISDLIETQSFSDNFRFNGRTVTFTSAVKHEGDPTKGYKIDSRACYRIIGDYSSNGTLVYDGLYFYTTTSMASRSYIADSVNRTIVKNCLIIGKKSTNEIGIACGNVESNYCYIYNCKVYYCGDVGIGANSGTAGGTPQTKYIENCSVYDCGLNTDPAYRSGVRPFTGPWVLKNVVSCNTTAGQSGYVNFGSFDGTATYCASSDASVPSGTGNISSIVPADEFESLTSTDATFLFLKSPYSGVLADGGGAPNVAGPTDISGNDRPSLYGYAIGSNEALIVISPSSSVSPSLSPLRISKAELSLC